MVGTSKWTAEQKQACYAAKDRGLSKTQVARELNRLFPRCGKVFDESAVKYALGLRGKGPKSGDASGSRAELSAHFMTPETFMSLPISATPKLSRLPTAGWSYAQANLGPMGQQHYGLNTASNSTSRQSTPNNGPIHAQAYLGNMGQQKFGQNTDPNPVYGQVTPNNDSSYPPPNFNRMSEYQQQKDRRAQLSHIPCHLPRDALSAGLLGIRHAESHSAEEYANNTFETQPLQSNPMDEIQTSANWGYNQLFGNVRERFNPSLQMPAQGIYAAASYVDPQGGTIFPPPLPTVSKSDWMCSDGQERIFPHDGSGTLLHPNSGSVSDPSVGVHAGIPGNQRYDQKAPRAVTLPGSGQSSDNLGQEPHTFTDFVKTSVLPSSARQAQSPQPLGNSSPLSRFKTGKPADISSTPSMKLRCTIAGNNNVACVNNLAGSHAVEDAYMTDPLKKATGFKSNLRMTTAAVSMLEPSLLDLRAQFLPMSSPCSGSALPTLELTQPANAMSKTHIPLGLKLSTNSRHIHMVHHQRPASQLIEPPVQAVPADNSAAVFSSGTCVSSAPTHHTPINESPNRLPIKRKREGAETEASGAVESLAKRQRLQEDLEVKSDDMNRELFLRQAECDFTSCGPNEGVPRKILESEDFLLKEFERAEDNPAPAYCPSDAMLAECYNSEIYEGLMLWRDLSVKCEERSYIPCGPSLKKGGDELAEAVADGTFRELVGRKFAEFEAEMQKIRDYEAKAYRHRMDGTKSWLDLGYLGPARYASPDTYRTLFR